MRIRPIEPRDWRRFRRIRLRALAGAPDAFSATLTGEKALDPAEWRRRSTPSPQNVTLLAEVSGKLVGLCAVLRDGTERTARLVAMWVEPEHRSHGIGAALVEAAGDWCHRAGVERLTLWVNEANAAAIKLYRGQGFVATGEREPLRPGSEAMMIAMDRTIDSAGGPPRSAVP